MSAWFVPAALLTLMGSEPAVAADGGPATSVGFAKPCPRAVLSSDVLDPGGPAVSAWFVPAALLTSMRSEPALAADGGPVTSVGFAKPCPRAVVASRVPEPGGPAVSAWFVPAAALTWMGSEPAVAADGGPVTSVGFAKPCPTAMLSSDGLDPGGPDLSAWFVPAAWRTSIGVGAGRGGRWRSCDVRRIRKARSRRYTRSVLSRVSS